VSSKHQPFGGGHRSAVNAVLDALAPLAVKNLEMPAASERIWQRFEMRVPADKAGREVPKMA
jgi:hypothetical protein